MHRELRHLRRNTVARRQHVHRELRDLFTERRAAFVAGGRAAPVRPDGRRWVAEIRYQFAPEWDTDIYPAGV
jgi:hypothetical protein